MTIRVLCLHGMGTDSTILKAQLRPVLELLPSYYTFTFPDGPVLCDPSPGVADHYSGPYRCWFKTPSNERVAAAIDHVGARAADFDVVVGFSQGGALAASMLMRQRLEGAEPAFRAAMFICSPLPFSCTPDNGIDVRRYFGVDPDSSPLPGRRTSVPGDLVADSYFLRDEDSDPAAEKPLYYNMFHPDVDDVRISIPTAHVHGRKDSWRQHSRQLVGLCDRSKAKVFEHGGGHEVPRDAQEDLCDLFEDLVARAGLLH